MSAVPQVHASADDCVEAALARVGRTIVLGAPIALGKPVQLLNAFYRRAAADRSISLTIFTGLSLERPGVGEGLQKRFLEPLFQRVFGDYEDLDYMLALRSGGLPPNIRVHEFYFRAGAMKNVPSAQRDYISSNYTFATRDMQLRGMNVMAQLVGSATVDGRPMLSLGSNADTSLDLLPLMQRRRREGPPAFTIGQVHPDMPFMYNRALVAPASFDALLDDAGSARTLFAPPNESVSLTDFAIGLHASTLLRDGGTLQIGIGSLGDAIAHSARLRHQHNDDWRALTGALGVNASLQNGTGGDGPFERGLYGCSEMFVNGFLHLMQAGIVRRRVYDDVRLQHAINLSGDDRVPCSALLQALRSSGAIGERLGAAEVELLRGWGVFAPDVELHGEVLRRGGAQAPARLASAADADVVAALACGAALCGGIHMHGGFFLGPRDFYRALRELPRAQAELIGMDSVRCINRIDEPSLREAQRLHARFINTGMMVTLAGAVVSDALESGEVISGVGGQYNFVAQAHELPGARSVILLRSTRGSGDGAASCIVPRYGHVTIPRHLRDIVVTEYGAVDLRAASDEEIVQQLLSIADSRFQPQLLAAAQQAGRIAEDYEIPEPARNNLPERVQAVLGPWRARGFLPAFPLGTDFTPEEIELGRSLQDIKALMEHPTRLAAALLRAATTTIDDERARPYLERMDLMDADGAHDRLARQLLLLDLHERGVIG